MTRCGQGGRVRGNLFPVGAGAGGSSACPHMRWAAGEAGCLRKWGLAPHSTRRVEAERPPLDLTPYLGGPRARRWATRKGRGCDASAVRPESGVGGLVPSPAAGDRGKKEPGCRCPTGPALRPTSTRGESGKPGWSVSSQPPEGDWREGHRGGGLRAETPGRAHSSGLYVGVRHPLWGTGREPTGSARHTLAPLSELGTS